MKLRTKAARSRQSAPKYEPLFLRHSISSHWNAYSPKVHKRSLFAAKRSIQCRIDQLLGSPYSSLLSALAPQWEDKTLRIGRTTTQWPPRSFLCWGGGEPPNCSLAFNLAKILCFEKAIAKIAILVFRFTSFTPASVLSNEARIFQSAEASTCFVPSENYIWQLQEDESIYY